MNFIQSCCLVIVTLHYISQQPISNQIRCQKYCYHFIRISKMVNIFCVFFDAKWATTRVVVHKKVCHVMFSSLVLINHAFHESYFWKKVHFPQKIKLVKIHDIAFSTRARKVVLWYFFKREIREENLQFNFRSNI